MDKETLSNYGWVVICVLVLAVMIALATPFGHYIEGAVKNTTSGMFGASSNALDTVGISIGEDNWGSANSNGGNKEPISLNHSGTIPDGGIYTTGAGQVLTASAAFPALQDGDTYEYGDYKYTYYTFLGNWEPQVIDKSKTHYNDMLEVVNGLPITSIDGVFENCVNLVEAPAIPATAIEWGSAFANCKSLKVAPVIPEGVKGLSQAFANCTALTAKPAIPSTSQNTEDDIFDGCTQFGY